MNTGKMEQPHFTRGLNDRLGNRYLFPQMLEDCGRFFSKGMTGSHWLPRILKYHLNWASPIPTPYLSSSLPQVKQQNQVCKKAYSVHLP